MKIIGFSDVDGPPNIGPLKLEEHVNPAVSPNNRTDLVDPERILGSAGARAPDHPGVRLTFHLRHFY